MRMSNIMLQGIRTEIPQHITCIDAGVCIHFLPAHCNITIINFIHNPPSICANKLQPLIVRLQIKFIPFILCCDFVYLILSFLLPVLCLLSFILLSLNHVNFNLFTRFKAHLERAFLQYISRDECFFKKFLFSYFQGALWVLAWIYWKRSTFMSTIPAIKV